MRHRLMVLVEEGVGIIADFVVLGPFIPIRPVGESLPSYKGKQTLDRFDFSFLL